MNQCEGHNQDASKTTPSYIAFMPFQAPSRLLRELIQLAAREPQTSPAELIHTRSKEREDPVKRPRECKREKVPFFAAIRIPHATLTPFHNGPSRTELGACQKTWSVACFNSGSSQVVPPSEMRGAYAKLKLVNPRSVRPAVRRPCAAQATAAATATSFSRVSRR